MKALLRLGKTPLFVSLYTMKIYRAKFIFGEFFLLRKRRYEIKCEEMNEEK